MSALLAATAAIAIAAGAATQSQARTGATCFAPVATFYLDDKGVSLRAAGAFKNNPQPEFDQLRNAYKFVDPPGSSGSGGCSALSWETATFYLGDKRDWLRLDARKPDQPGFTKIPKAIEVNAYAGPGPDRLRGHRGVDHFKGEGGNDVINVADGDTDDIVRCGPGNDKAIIDRGDTVMGCETVIRR